MKTNLDHLFKTNSTMEEEGNWFNLSDDIGFRMRRFNDTNPNVRKALATYFKPYARQIEMGTMDPAKEREIMVKLFVNSSMIDWRGVEIDGKATPFSKEVAVKFLLGLPDLFQSLMAYAQDFKNFQAEDEGSKEELGNS